jgi:osmotically-inducible protein OsmY
MARETATSYDDILRSTVVDPDLSRRPSRDEEELSQHRFGAVTEHRPHRLSPNERVLLARVRDVLTRDGALDLSAVELAVDGHAIILMGFVPGPSTKVRLAQLTASVRGVDHVDNQLVVRSRRA